MVGFPVQDVVHGKGIIRVSLRLARNIHDDAWSDQILRGESLMAGPTRMESSRSAQMGAGMLSHGKSAEEIPVLLKVCHGFEFHAGVAGPLRNIRLDGPTEAYNSGK